ncbi:MAG: hypothetical protein V4760_19865, partial [Bdellovibrionota bacterium]
VSFCESNGLPAALTPELLAGKVEEIEGTQLTLAHEEHVCINVLGERRDLFAEGRPFVESSVERFNGDHSQIVLHGTDDPARGTQFLAFKELWFGNLNEAEFTVNGTALSSSLPSIAEVGATDQAIGLKNLKLIFIACVVLLGFVAAFAKSRGWW